MRKILIAEDEKAIGSALSNKLSAEGYEVTLVEDGAAALEQLKTNHYDLAFVDLIMTNVDGFKVLEEMKDSDNNTPLVVFSNLAQDTDKERALELGAAGFYIKADISLSEISDIVKKYIR